MWNDFQERKHFTIVLGVLSMNSKRYYFDFIRYSNSYRVRCIVSESLDSYNGI